MSLAKKAQARCEPKWATASCRLSFDLDEQLERKAKFLGCSKSKLQEHILSEFFYGEDIGTKQVRRSVDELRTMTPLQRVLFTKKRLEELYYLWLERDDDEAEVA